MGLSPSGKHPPAAHRTPRTNKQAARGSQHFHLHFPPSPSGHPAPLQEVGTEPGARPRLQPGVLGGASQQAPHSGCQAEGTSSSHTTVGSKLQRTGPPSSPRSSAARPARGALLAPEESREEGSVWPPARSRYSPGAPAGRTRAGATRTWGEAYHGKGLQSQSRLASQSLLNHTEQEVYSRALKASRDQEEHPARAPAHPPPLRLPQPAAQLVQGHPCLSPRLPPAPPSAASGLSLPREQPPRG